MILISIASLYITSYFTGIEASNIASMDKYYIIVCSLSKVLLLLFTFIVLHKKIDLNMSLNFQNWWLLLFNEIIILVTIVILSYSIIVGAISIDSLHFILFLLIVICFSSLFIVYQTSKINQEMVNQEKYIKRKEFQAQNLSILKNLKNEIDAIGHRTFYILFKIQYHIKNKEYDIANTSIDNYLKTVTRQQLIIVTGNDIFDCLINLKLKELKMESNDLKLCINITESDFYNDFTFINSMISILNTLSNCESIELYISEVNEFIIIELYFTGQEFNNIQLNDSILKMISNSNSSYKIDVDSILKTAKILIDRRYITHDK